MGKKRKITVVTGAAGHVGGNLIRTLLERGDHVRVLVHQDLRAIQDLDVEIVRGDVCHSADLERAFSGADVVYHGAAVISLLLKDRSRIQKINIEGVRNVVNACIKCNVSRLVHFSSIHAHAQHPLNECIDEDRPFVEDSRWAPYDYSKAAGEAELRKGMERGLNAVIINPTGIIGPFDFKPSHTGDAIQRMATGRLPALVRGGFDWVDVRDVVEMAIRAEETAASGSKYIISGHWAPVADIAVLVERITGIKRPRFVSPLWLAQVGVPFIGAYAALTKTRPLYTTFSLMTLRGNRCMSHDRASRELGYRPRPFEETIQDTVKWFQEAGYIS